LTHAEDNTERVLEEFAEVRRRAHDLGGGSSVVVGENALGSDGITTRC